MDKNKIKLLAFDLDGTLTQHRSPLSEENRETLYKLGEKYRLVMAGAGTCRRIYGQLGAFPIDIIGNYGMQTALYDKEKNDIVVTEDISVGCDKQSVDKRIRILREKYGFNDFCGDCTEFHPSGCVTFPILGTKADIKDKLAFDPDRKKRRTIYEDVKNTFPEFTVFIGGSSSFDMAPRPYDKNYALTKYCRENGISPLECAYAGDDYGEGGNDEAVYKSEFNFIKVDDYKKFPEIMEFLL